MRHRFEYMLELKDLNPTTAPGTLAKATWRNPSLADQQILAELMLDSYRDTIDYDGETMEDSIREVESYFSSQDSAWLESSWLGFMENSLASASLVGFWKDRNSPLIAYVMTASQWKGKHFATVGVWRSIQSLTVMDHDRVYAVITEGNTPSEQVFTRLGFRRLALLE